MHGLAHRVDRREALCALERDGARVLAQVVRLDGPKKLSAVLEQELVKEVVEFVETLPHALVHLDGERELVGEVDARERRALKGHLHGKALERGEVRRHKLERRSRHHRVNVADAVARLHELEGHAALPCHRKVLDVGVHFFCV